MRHGAENSMNVKGPDRSVEHFAKTCATLTRFWDHGHNNPEVRGVADSCPVIANVTNHE